MQYRAIAKNEDVLDSLYYVLDDEDKQYRYYGKTLGCGCCSVVSGMEASDLSQHVEDLRAALEQAERALADVEAYGALL